LEPRNFRKTIQSSHQLSLESGGKTKGLPERKLKDGELFDRFLKRKKKI
jgi:hypothetical protein